MLMTCDSQNVDEVLKSLKSVNVEATIIGEILDNESERVIEFTDSKSILYRPETDALWGALKKITTS